MLKEWFSKIGESLGRDEKHRKKLPWIIALGFFGIVLLVLPSLKTKEEPTQDQQKPTSQQGVQEKLSADASMQDYEYKYETELANVLSRIVGVDDVTVLVNLDSSEEEVFATDVRDTEQVTNEADKRGGNRSISQSSNDKKTAYYRTEGGDKPVIIKKIKPRVRGVVVVARGVENLQVKAIVIEAIQRALDVPVHRISVQPRK